MILVVVGLPGSGKSTVAELLRKRGYEVIEFGDIWRELLKKAKIPMNDPRITREFTKTLREKKGKDIYARYAVKKIKKSTKPIVIMGLRSTYELDYLKKHLKNIKIISLEATFEERFDRLKKRSKPEDPKNIKDFTWLNTREKRGFMSDKREQKHGVLTVMRMADYRIKNTKTIAFMERQLDRTLKLVENRKPKQR